MPLSDSDKLFLENINKTVADTLEAHVHRVVEYIDARGLGSGEAEQVKEGLIDTLFAAVRKGVRDVS